MKINKMLRQITVGPRRYFSACVQLNMQGCDVDLESQMCGSSLER